MKKKKRLNVTKIKKANILHHNLEAKIFERAHPEGGSLYERAQVLKNINIISLNSTSRELCIDVGCGTGFVTSFEMPFYTTIVATDISRRMLEVVKKKLGHFNSLSLLVCDAEFLPLQSEIADLVSVSSVLHHLPKPHHSMAETLRILKQNGFYYVTREPNFQRFRRFIEFFDQAVVQKIVKLISRLSIFRPQFYEPNITAKGLDYATVDVHYPTGFHVAQLADLLHSKDFEIFSAYSYHWIYPDSEKGLLQQLLTKSNFIIELIPFSKKIGRYISIVAKKSARAKLIN